MRANLRVCVEADEVVSSQNWMSVIVLGSYEELPDTPEWSRERAAAFSLLRHEAMWWEPAYVKTAIHGRMRSLEPLFYRIHIDTITGHRATREPSPRTAPPAAGRIALAPTSPWKRLRALIWKHSGLAFERSDSRSGDGGLRTEVGASASTIIRTWLSLSNDWYVRSISGGNDGNAVAALSSKRCLETISSENGTPRSASCSPIRVMSGGEVVHVFVE